MVNSFANFDLVQRVELDSTDVVVTKWRSRITGLSIVHADCEAPIVKAYFVLRTESLDDSGCPHALEHLVLSGSKKFPYNGVLNVLTTRGFSNGVDAWTSSDHTCYTISTAGDQGLLQTLPVFVNHILYPSLKKSDFITEVHHIDQVGQDSGVVYCEMQGRENTPADLMEAAARRLLHSESTGYKNTAIGLTKGLRTLKIEQVRKYHAKYYVPDNLCLVVAGKLTEGPSSLLSVIQREIEPSLMGSGYNEQQRMIDWIRHTSAAEFPNPELFTSKSVTILFPDKVETVGHLLLTLKGPEISNYLHRKALEVLSIYLTLSVAPQFAELENPLCDSIHFEQIARPNFVHLRVLVRSVLTRLLGTFDKLLRKCFEKIAKEGIDMVRMQTIITRDRLRLLIALENSRADTFVGTIIEDFVLGPEDGCELANALDTNRFHDELALWRSSEWVSLLESYYIDAPIVIVRGKPSSKLADKLEKEERARIDAQVRALGSLGLLKKKKELEEATVKNSVSVPEHVLAAFPIPDVQSISWIPVKSYREGDKVTTVPPGAKEDSKLSKHILADGTELPFFVQFDHVESDFVEVHALMSLAALPDYLRSLVKVYQLALFTLPMETSSGEALGFGKANAMLKSETVQYECGLGMQNHYSENFRISIKVEKRKYDNAVRWLRDLIYGVEFDRSRLQVTCAKSLHSMDRGGDTVLSSYRTELLFGKSSTIRAGSSLEQMQAIPELLLELKMHPDKVRKKFKELRAYLTDPSGMRFSVAGNILELPKPRGVWAKYFHELLHPPLRPVRYLHETLSDTGRSPRKKAIVVCLSTTESSYADCTTRTFRGFDHPAYPALRVALEVMNAKTGYIWQRIRGMGLAYHVQIRLNIEAGLLSFYIYRTSNCVQTLRQAASVVRGLVNGSLSLDSTAIDAAKSTLTYYIANSVSTPDRAALSSFMSQALAGVSKDFNRSLVEKCQAVSKEDVLATLRQYVLPLFDASTSVATVVSPPSKAAGIAKDLRELGFDVEKLENGELSQESKRLSESMNRSEPDLQHCLAPLLRNEKWIDLTQGRSQKAGLERTVSRLFTRK